VEWSSRPLRVHGNWQALAAPIEQRLIDTKDGSIDWHCIAPCAQARIDLPDHSVLQGLGYVERLRLTIPPWSLPFHTLHWGRFGNPEHNLVWIRWDGHCPMTLVAHNGVQSAQATVSELGVCTDELVLEWSDAGRVLRNGPIVRGAIRGLSWRMPPAFAAAREEKWLSRAKLHCAGRDVSGWAIHEIVHFA
jgi:hypothetical protein